MSTTGAPWIGMTRGFWKDPGRYESTYWNRWPGIWVHGDWAAIDGDGMWYILGRSDDTIKVAGKRTGPAEIEAALRKHFDDWARRLSLVQRVPLRPLDTGHKPLQASVVGMDWDEFVQLVKATTVRGAVPEPVRIAHIVSAAMVKGESRGRS